MIRRRSYQNIRNALGRQAAVVLLGARQVGKTTLALEVAEIADAVYLDLESRADRDKLAEPALYLGEYEDRLVILDDSHRTPALFQELRGLTITVMNRRTQNEWPTGPNQSPGCPNTCENVDKY